MDSLSSDDRSHLIRLISEKVERRLGVPEKAVIRAAIDCAKSNLSKKSTAKELSSLVDKELSETIADDLNNIISSFLKKVKDKIATSRKRPRNQSNEHDEKPSKLAKKSGDSLKKKHVKTEVKSPIKDEQKAREEKDGKVSIVNSSDGNDVGNSAKKVVSTQTVKTDGSSSILENLKRQIEIRKKMLADAVSSGQKITLQDAQLKYLDQLSTKSKQAILIQQQLQSQLSERVKAALLKNNPDLFQNVGDGIKNEVVEKVEQFNNGTTSVESGKLTTKTVDKNQPKLTHFDSRVKTKSLAIRKPPRSFHFNDPGKFVTMANNIRTKERLEKLQQQIQTTAKKTGIASAAKLAMVTMRHDSEPHNIPNMEWWDSAILPYQSYNAFMADLKQVGGDIKLLKDQLMGINKLIEHPIEQLPPNESKDIHMPLFLTKKEQKKIRSQRRRVKEIEKQERIRVGLEPPPPPKVKLSNLMRVLGSEAVQDPTKVEAHVREQIAARLKAHEAANAARKLTPEQKRLKKIKKLKEDVSVGVHTAVYRVWDLSNPSRKFKVDVNAQQLYLSGCILLIQDMNLVIVEGGPKAQKKFKQLMLNRIKWEEDVIGQCATHADRIKPKDENSRNNKCELVWEGINRKKNFHDFKIKQVVTDSVAREFLKKHNCEHFWDLAYTLSLDSDIQKK